MKLDDGVQKVFVTSAGDDSNLPEAVREFLQYLRDPAKIPAGNELLDSIETAVLANRRSAKMEEEYMYLEDYGRHLKEEERAHLYSLVQNGYLAVDKAAFEVKLSVEEFEKQMTAAGFKLPDTVS